MYLKTLKLQNIRSYVEDTINFPSGSCLLAGDIGAGKSTILLAIEFALFGAKRGELGAGSLLRNGAHAGKIELILELHGKEVKISRTLKRSSTTVKQEAGYVVMNNERLDATPMELRAKIIELLGYPKEAITKTKDLIYRYTVFTPQEQMRQIIYDDKEARLNTLRKVFHIDKYKRIKENAQITAREMKTRKRLLEETVSDTDKLLDDKKKKHEMLIEFKELCEKEKPLMDELKKNVNTIHENILKIEVKQKELQGLEQKKAVSTADLEKNNSYKKQINEQRVIVLNHIFELEKKLSVQLKKPKVSKVEIENVIVDLQRIISRAKERKVFLDQEKKSVQDKIAYINDELAGLREAVEHKCTYEEQIKELEKQLDKKAEIEQSIEKQEKRLLELTKDIISSEMQKNNSEEIIKNIETIDTCTLCQQKIPHLHKQRIIRSQQIARAGAGALTEQLTLQKDEITKLLAKFKNEKKEITLAEKKIAVVQSVLHTTLEKEKDKKIKEMMLSELDKKSKEIADEISKIIDVFSIEKDLDEKKKILEEIHLFEKALLERNNIEFLLKEKQLNIKQLDLQKKEVDGHNMKLEEELKNLEDDILRYKESPNEYAKEKENLISAQEIERKQEIKIFGLEKDIQNVKQQIVLLDKEIEDKKLIKEKIRNLGLYADWIMEYFVPLINTMEKQVMLQVHSSFNTLFTSWFAVLMDDDSISARLDEEFSPIIEQNGYETILTDLSGGEKTAVALAYRLALNKVINDFVSSINTKDLIILDEPTDGFSAQQLDKVREVLDQLNMRQVILVSHENKIESFVENVLRIEKTGHVSRVIS